MDLVSSRPHTNVFPPRWRLLLLAATCWFFTGISLVPATFGGPFWTRLGWVGVAVFGSAGAVLLWRALRPGPTLVIDARGITDRTTLAPTGLVRWDEIAAVRKREIGRGMGREQLLEIVLLDPDEFRARPRSLPRRLADRYRSLIKQPDVTVPRTMVSMPTAELIEEMRRWNPDLEVLELPPPRPKRVGRRPPAGGRSPYLPR